MPIVDTNALPGAKKATSVAELLNTLLTSEVVVYFKDDSGKAVGDRSLIDKMIADYSRDSSDVSVYNKWIQIDSTLDKAVKKFTMETTNLLNTLNSQSEVQTTINNSLPPPQNPMGQPQQAQPQGQKSGLDKQLPVNESKFDAINQGPIAGKISNYLSKGTKKLNQMEKDLVDIGTGPEQAKALVRNQQYKKAETHPEVNTTKPYTDAMIDDIIEQAEKVGLSLQEVKQIIKEMYDVSGDTLSDNVFALAANKIKGVPATYAIKHLKDVYNYDESASEESLSYIEELMVGEDFEQNLHNYDISIPTSKEGMVALYMAMHNAKDIQKEYRADISDKLY